jgi:succinyl-diaminopimelate desuccinylase
VSLTETLRWLVDTPSLTGEEGRICTQIAIRLSESIGRPDVERIGSSLVAGRRSGRPLIVLAGHLDTVPDQGQGPAEIRKGRLHGLGSADMKAGLAVIIHLLEDPDVRLGPYDVIGVLYAGEEGPSSGNELEQVLDRVAWLKEAAFAVVLEPSDGEIQIGCNGVINAQVRFTGKAAHSARPWLGENAISKAGEWLAGMHRRPPRPVSLRGLEFTEVMSVTRAAGGIASNVIPAAFELNLNYRFTPDKSIAEAEASLREACAAADEVVVTDSAPAGAIDVDHPFLDRLLAASGAARTGKQGWTDVARFGTHGVPAVNFGPGETSLAHQPGESVAISDLEASFAILKTSLTES